MTVRYHQRGDQDLPTYVCQRDGIANGHRICTTIPGHSDDARIGMLLIETLTPLTIEAALTVQAELQHRADEADALRAAHVERARYHAELARRRYLAVDPVNRLVATPGYHPALGERVGGIQRRRRGSPGMICRHDAVRGTPCTGGNEQAARGSRLNSPSATHPRRDGCGHHGCLRNRRAAPGRDSRRHDRGLRNRRADDTDSSDTCWPEWHFSLLRSPLPGRPRSRR